MTDRHQTLFTTLLAMLLTALAILSASSNVSALGQADKDGLHKRALALRKLLDMSAEQTNSIETILLNARELGEANQNQFGDDYYALAIANLATMDSVRIQVDRILTEPQRAAYRKLRNSSQQHFSSHDGAALSRRLLLDSAQSRTVDMILTYAEQDIEKIRRESANSGGAFGRGFRGGSYRGNMMRRRAKMQKAHQAIEKLLSKAQKKEFREYVDEQMEQFRPQSGADDHDHDGGF